MRCKLDYESHGGLFIETCSTIRLWRGLAAVETMENFEISTIAMWMPSESSLGIQKRGRKPGDVDDDTNAKELAQQLKGVNSGSQKWQAARFIQFLGMESGDTPQAIAKMADIHTIEELVIIRCTKPGRGRSRKW